MMEEIADESVGEVACLILGMIVERMATASGLAAAEPRTVGFAHAFRLRLRQCLQHLRVEADRHGVRDCLRAVVRNDSVESAAACRAVLKLIASPPAAGVAPVPVVELAERALRMVQGKGLQATLVMTRNICGEERAAFAPADFTPSDKMGWPRAELELLRPEIHTLQECPSEIALPCLCRLFTLVGTAKAHAGYVHLYVLSNCDMQTNRMDSMRRNAPSRRCGGEGRCANGGRRGSALGPETREALWWGAKGVIGAGGAMRCDRRRCVVACGVARDPAR